MPDGYGYTDPKTNQRVSALRDMFDGGGMGRSGNQFQGGGAISALGNALKIRPLGSTAPREQIGFRGRMGSREYFRDMFDGGGAGASSSAGFADGPYSGIANNLMALGLLRPLGATRGAQAVPRLRPSVDMPLSTMGAPDARVAYGSDVTVGGTGAADDQSTGGTGVTNSQITETILPLLRGPTARGGRRGMSGQPAPTPYRFSEPLSSPQYARDMSARDAANAFGGTLARNPQYDPAQVMRALGLYYGRSGF